MVICILFTKHFTESLCASLRQWNVFAYLELRCLEQQVCRVQVVQLLVSAAIVQVFQLVLSPKANAQPFQWPDMSA